MPFWSKRKSQIIPNSGQISLSPAQANPPATSVRSPLDELRRQAEQFSLQGDYFAAVGKYSTILSQEPDDVTSLLARSVAYVNIGSVNLELALQDADRAIDLLPNSAQAWSQKGHALLGAQRYNEAEQAVIHALRLSTASERLGPSQLLAQIQAQKRQSGAITPQPPHIHSAPDSPAPASAGQSYSPNTMLSPLTSNLPHQGESRTPNLPSPVASPQLASPDPSHLAPVSPAMHSPTPNVAAVQADPEPSLDAPPSYSATNNNDTSQVEQQLIAKEQGMIKLAASTSADKFDTIDLQHVGYTAVQSRLYDLNAAPQLHAKLGGHHVSMITLPGNTWIDMDPESHMRNDGFYPGTLSVMGANESYRAAQLRDTPAILLALESHAVPPVMPLQAVLARLNRLTQSPTLEDNTGLRDVLGMKNVPDFTSRDRQFHIDTICMCLNKGFAEQPHRFFDFTKVDCISAYFLAGSEETFRDFLFLIILGHELLCRMRKETAVVSYSGLVTDRISALMVISSKWMIDNIVSPRPTSGSSLLSRVLLPKYVVATFAPDEQAEALVRFAEHMMWPYMDQLRHYIRAAYGQLAKAPAEVPPVVRDWLFMMHRPGKIFRNLLMSVVVLSSGPVKVLGQSLLYQEGLLVRNNISYWPATSVLGRVLGAIPDIKYACSMIGPVNVLTTGVNAPAWAYVRSSLLGVPVPISKAQDLVSSLLGLEVSASASPRPQTQADLARWVPPKDLPTHLPRSTAKLDSISLFDPQATTVVGRTSYLARLHFTLNTGETSHSMKVQYVLYNSPDFVAAPQCVGPEHPIHENVVQTYFGQIYKTIDLLHCNPDRNKMMIIDARGEGEEVVARAWCAERGRHAIVRRTGRCCFTCATKLASREEGLGYFVLIWAK